MKILIVSGYADDVGSANTICINEIGNALRLIPDVEVVVTGNNLTKDAMREGWKNNPIFAVRKIIHWPVANPNSATDCFRQIEDELNNSTYDAVLVCHMPYDCVLAAKWAKRKHRNVLFLLYELDPISYDIDRERKSLGKYLYFLRLNAELTTYSIFDKIIHMECNHKKFEQKKYKRFEKKSFFLDFPLIHDLGIEEKSAEKINNNIIHLLYTGKLMSHFRSPEYLLKLIVAVHSLLDIDISFFSDGDCEELIHDYSQKYPFIKQCGFVEHSRIALELKKCDCLVNISNKLSDMLPSKLLTYIETGKPILHIQNQPRDACISYLSRYDNALILTEELPVDISAIKFASFINSNYGKLIDSRSIVDEFNCNTAGFSAESICNLVSNKN